MSLAIGLVLMTGIAAADGAAPDWCTTLERWELKGQGGSAIAGGCPTAGSCDVPAVRDTHAPDAATPFKLRAQPASNAPSSKRPSPLLIHSLFGPPSLAT